MADEKIRVKSYFKKGRKKDGDALITELNIAANAVSTALAKRRVKVTLVDNEDDSVRNEAHPNLEDGEIKVYTSTKDPEVIRGSIYHGLFRKLLSKKVDKKEFSGSDDQKRNKALIMRSLEEFRIDGVGGGRLFEPSDYYLWKFDLHHKRNILSQNEIQEVANNPILCLHYLLAGLDVTAFTKDKELRFEVRRLAQDLQKAGFDGKAKTRDLIPLTEDAFERLGKWIVVPPQESNDALSLVLKSNVPPDEEPVVEDASQAGEGGGDGEDEEEEDGGKPQPKRTIRSGTGGKRVDEDDIFGKVPPIKWKQDSEYQRPVKCKLIREFKAEDYMKELALESDMVTEGRKLGRRLVQFLKMNDRQQIQQETGEVDMEEVFHAQMEGRGRLKRRNVFTRDEPLIRKHTVLILIDFSGSMALSGEGEKEVMARNAALLLSTALDEMNVEHSIRGFSAISDKPLITEYVMKEFGRPVNKNSLSRMSFSRKKHLEDGENRDSASLEAALDELAAEGGKKIIFLISDGQPAHQAFPHETFMANSVKDMRRVIAEADEVGVSVIGVGITEGAANFIKSAYQKGFFIRKLSELPDKLFKIYLKETGDTRAK